MVPPRSDFKVETYQRLTALTKTRLSNIKIAVNALFAQTDPLTVVQLKTLNTYKAEVLKKKEEFESNVNRLLSVWDEDVLTLESLTSDQEDINDLYVHISSHIESLISVNEPKGNGDSTSLNNLSTINNVHSNVRLPKFELPKFFGDLSTWTSFINLYDTTIHNNDSLSDVMKFQYLLSTLDKEPLNMIRSLNLTASNYMVAYNLLRDRYHNDRRLQLIHLNNLLDLPNISSSNMPGVRQLLNTFNENTQVLSTLQCEISQSDPLMVAILLRKMDLKLRTRLESFRATSSVDKHTLPTTKQIIDFLTSECNYLEDATLSHDIQHREFISTFNQSKPPKRDKPNFKNPANTLTTQAFRQTHLNNSDTQVQCFVCKETSHKVYACTVFKKKTPNERYELVKQHNQCVSCLGNHNIKQCKSQLTCNICHKRHHTMLHFHTVSHNIPSKNGNVCCQTASSESPHPNNSDSSSVTLTSQQYSCHKSPRSTVLLGTLLVKIKTLEGNTQVFRAMLDSGSMCDLITERAANLLGVSRSKSDIQLSGINQSVARNKGQTTVDIETLSGHSVASQHPMLILDKLTLNLPRLPVSNEVLKLAQSYLLADPNFHKPGRIDIVLGASLFPQILTYEQHSLGQQMPYVIGTHFGFVVMGSAPVKQDLSSHTTLTSPVYSNLNVCLHAISNSELHTSLQRFWQQEEPPTCTKKAEEDTLCDLHFTSTHSRDNTGRYIVHLPFKDSEPQLGFSQIAAERRLKSMERKFTSDSHFSQLYHDFMNEYSSLGHMSKCNN